MTYKIYKICAVVIIIIIICIIAVIAVIFTMIPIIFIDRYIVYNVKIGRFVNVSFIIIIIGIKTYARRYVRK